LRFRAFVISAAGEEEEAKTALLADQPASLVKGVADDRHTALVGLGVIPATPVGVDETHRHIDPVGRVA